MESKGLLIRRILYVALFILSLVFISIKGGNLPYMLFFLMVMNTVFSYAHILYVFNTITIFQNISEVDITKNETFVYHLRMNNEGIIAYGSIRLRFMDDLSQIMEKDKLGIINLEPGQKMEFHSEMLCKYSGIYYAGVDTIEIMDYFKIFRIRFPMPQKMRVTIKPRMMEPTNISFLLEEEEQEGSSQMGKSEYQFDNEVKKYASGDNRKLIHWKNSAKRQELMVRNPADEEISGYTVILDANMEELDYKNKIIICDKLREITVALVHYIHGAGYLVYAVLSDFFEKEIYSITDFDELYSQITRFGFEHPRGWDETLFRLNREVQEGVPFVIISASPQRISEEIRNELKVFRNIHVIDVNQINVDEMDFQDAIHGER